MCLLSYQYHGLSPLTHGQIDIHLESTVSQLDLNIIRPRVSTLRYLLLYYIYIYISIILLSKNLTDLIRFINKEPRPTGSGSLFYGRLQVLQ